MKRLGRSKGKYHTIAEPMLRNSVRCWQAFWDSSNAHSATGILVPMAGNANGNQLESVWVGERMGYGVSQLGTFSTLCSPIALPFPRVKAACWGHHTVTVFSLFAFLYHCDSWIRSMTSPQCYSFQHCKIMWMIKRLSRVNILQSFKKLFTLCQLSVLFPPPPINFSVYFN